MSETFSREIEVALAAVRQAAKVCKAVQSRLTVDAYVKEDRSPVTLADLSSQALICRALLKSFPDDPVIGEEDTSLFGGDEGAERLELVRAELRAAGIESTGEVLEWIEHGSATEYSERFWTLDPIDGTKGFLRGEQYAVALALVEHGLPVVGLLGCPNLPCEGAGGAGTLFWAIRGEGAYAEPLDASAAARPIAASARTDPTMARFCESVEAAHSVHSVSAAVVSALGVTAAPVRVDSQAKYALVANGAAEVYLRVSRGGRRDWIWDHAAGVLVAEEAGGRVTDVDGRPLDFSKGARLGGSRGILATNGHLHDAVARALAQVGA